jgi:hypothetical protein
MSGATPDHEQFAVRLDRGERYEFEALLDLPRQNE